MGRRHTSQTAFPRYFRFVGRVRTARKIAEALSGLTGEPSMSFDTFDLHPDLLRAVAALGFTVPTPVQASAIPPGRAGRDVLACAATGTGKTAAFLLPIMHQLLAGPRRTTRVLVLAPTRELALQIQKNYEELNHLKLNRSVLVIGGANIRTQIAELRRKATIVIANIYSNNKPL